MIKRLVSRNCTLALCLGRVRNLALVAAMVFYAAVLLIAQVSQPDAASLDC